MAEALKHLYGKDYIDLLSVEIVKEFPDFPADRFRKTVFDHNWPELELKQRMRRISECLRTALPEDYVTAVETLMRVRPRMTGLKYIGFANICFADFVSCFGLEHFAVSIPALELFTIDSSSEFAVRPFILRYPEAMMKQMLMWAHHPHEHVRRLASEGCRPRLPWAMGLPAFKKDPSPILPILEKLKNDPSEFVRRSVANNLNDIAKDHPDLVIRLARRWSGHSGATDRLIRHACRTLLKRGHSGTLAHFGFNDRTPVKAERLKLSSAAVTIGGRLGFSFIVRSPKKQKVRMEYAIGFVTSSGKRSRKIFKIGETILTKDTPLAVSRTHSFRDLTIRKHFPGLHTLAVVINGKERARREFRLKSKK